ncbi:MAG: DinB family protein [Leptospiraceae bacterium]|nr:DinB family protein [Leptospiraceae bacterium]
MLKLEIENPYTKKEILSSFDDISEKVINFYSDIDPKIFFHKGLGGWSPAQNLAHITFINTATVYLFHIPKFLFLPFRIFSKPRSYTEVHQDYIFGSKTIPLGPLGPEEIEMPSDPKKEIESLCSAWKDICIQLKLVARNMDEEDMDKYFIIHPTLGGLSLRETFFLILIHPIHHSYNVEKKIENYLKQI